jgi:hypothetical protein
MLSYTACIEENNVRFIYFIGYGIAIPVHNTVHYFGIGKVHLAAIGFHI